MFDTIIFFALYCFYYYFANVNNQILWIFPSFVSNQSSCLKFQSSCCPQSYYVFLPYMRYYPILVFCTFCGQMMIPNPPFNTTCIIETIVWFSNPLRASNFQWTVHVWLILTFVVQSLSRVWLFMTPWTATCQASLSFTIFWSLLRFMSIELVMVWGQ